MEPTTQGTVRKDQVPDARADTGNIGPGEAFAIEHQGLLAAILLRKGQDAFGGKLATGHLEGSIGQLPTGLQLGVFEFEPQDFDDPETVGTALDGNTLFACHDQLDAVRMAFDLIVKGGKKLTGSIFNSTHDLEKVR